MSDQAHDGTCPHCGAELAVGESRCWLCLDARGDDREAAAAPRDPQRWTFGLSSLMLFVTLVAVTLGIAGLSPGLGVVFGVLVTPALIRTAVAARRARTAGDGMNVYEKAWAFLGSLGVVFCTSLAAGAAFFATCWVGAIGADAANSDLDAVIWTGIIGGVIAGMVVLVLMIRRLWPLRGKRP